MSETSPSAVPTTSTSRESTERSLMGTRFTALAVISSRKLTDHGRVNRESLEVAGPFEGRSRHVASLARGRDRQIDAPTSSGWIACRRWVDGCRAAGWCAAWRWFDRASWRWCSVGRGRSSRRWANGIARRRRGSTRGRCIGRRLGRIIRRGSGGAGAGEILDKATVQHDARTAGSLGHGLPRCALQGKAGRAVDAPAGKGRPGQREIG